MSAKKVIPATEEQSSRKSVRYIALSTLAHLGLLTMIAAMPRPQFGSAGQPNANATGTTVMMDIANPDAADSTKLGNGGEKEASAEQTALEAQASSPESSAQNLASSPVQPAPITPPAAEIPVAQPVTQPVVQAEAAPVEKPIAAVLPTKAPKASRASKSLAKSNKKPGSKIATTLPTKSGAAPAPQEEESLPEVVTWKATERAHEAALAQQAQDQAEANAAEEAAVAQAKQAAAQAAADTAASDQAAAAAAQQQAAAQAKEQSSASAQTLPSKHQGPSAIPITTQQFAPASAASSGTQNGASGALGRLGAPSGTQFRNAEEMVERPGNKAPSYPMQDRVSGHQGVVVLVGQVAQDGHVAKATVQQSSGSIAMDQASMTAFKNWKFAPGQEGYVYKSFRFSLAGEAQEVPARLAQ